MNFNLCTTPVQSSIKILQTELGLFEGQKWDHCLGRPSPLIKGCMSSEIEMGGGGIQGEQQPKSFIYFMDSV